MDGLSITRWSVALYWNTYYHDLDLARFASDPSALEAIQGIDHIYQTPTLVPDELAGMRVEVFFLVAMGLVWSIISYLALSLAGHQRHRRARPWKQRLHRARTFADRASLRILGPERQAHFNTAMRSCGSCLCGRGDSELP
ncbi:unnamed protein product [Effrenium voratum]|nr:unnamed protein product [Effrenium voratum]CAJ1417296.1 unnamed protein product [Effrenium voratum]